MQGVFDYGKTKITQKRRTAKEIITPTSVALPVDTSVTRGAAARPLPEPTTTDNQPTEQKKQALKRPRAKPEIVRNDAARQLVPINLDEEIRRFAYLLSERRGFEPGHEAEDWLAAENEIRQRYHQQGA